MTNKLLTDDFRASKTLSRQWLGPKVVDDGWWCLWSYKHSICLSGGDDEPDSESVWSQGHPGGLSAGAGGPGAVLKA